MKQFSAEYLEHMNIKKGNVIKQFFCQHNRTIIDMEEVSVRKSKYYDICADCGQTLIEGSFNVPLDDLAITLLSDNKVPAHTLFENGHKYYKKN